MVPDKASFDPADDRLSPVVFSTDAVEREGRFETWRDRFVAVNDLIVTREAVPGFVARSEQWRIGPVLFGVNRTPERRMVRSAKHCARDDMDHYVLRVCRTGQVVIRGDGDSCVAGPGDLFFSTLADGYDYEWSAGEWIAAIFPRDAFPTLSRGLSGMTPGLKTGVGADLLAGFLLSLFDELPRCRAADAPMLIEATRAMLAACLFSGSTLAAVAPEDAAQIGRRRVERIIRRDIGSPRLDARRISSLAGMSRSALYRLFEPHGGVSAYVQRLRLDLVKQDLADPALAREPIAKVVERRGFHCAPSFNRAFRRTFGHTPGEARHLALSGFSFAAEPHAPQRHGAAQSLSDLLR